MRVTHFRLNDSEGNELCRLTRLKKNLFIKFIKTKAVVIAQDKITQSINFNVLYLSDGINFLSLTDIKGKCNCCASKILWCLLLLF